MSDEAVRGKAQGAFAALALLLGLLLGVGQVAPSAFEAEAPASRFSPARPGKAPATLRIAQRDQQDDADDLSGAPPLPPAPRVVSASLLLVPAQAAAPAVDHRTGGHSASLYQARAPPAA